MPPPSTPTPAPRTASSLHTETRGQGPRLVLAHGFTQTARVWGSIDLDLARDHLVVAVDMPGHAGSTPLAGSLTEGAAWLGDAGGPASYLGYSMGARYCLHLALTRPELVERLVLVSGTAGIDDPDERRRRRRADEALAAELDPTGPSPTTAIPVEAFVRRWLEGPLFSGIDATRNGLEERLRNTGPGLASSLRTAGTGTQEPLWDRLAELTMPVLIITGGEDVKFTDLGRRMAAAVGPRASHRVIAGAGHAPHLQQPPEVAGLVRRHLAGDGRN
jgi:2-succinyl-6-hydroxy-2,4-cyclohexadiene-1-carboxylate synthase